MEDPLVKDIPEKKMRFLEELFTSGHGKSQKEMMAFLMPMMKKAKQEGLTLLNPVAPHITEELWQTAGFQGRVYQTSWPSYEEAKTVENTVEIGVQVNGKIRANISMPKDAAKEEVIAAAREAATVPP